MLNNILFGENKNKTEKQGLKGTSGAVDKENKARQHTHCIMLQEVRGS